MIQSVYSVHNDPKCLRAPTAPPGGNRKIRLKAIVRTDVLYRPTKFQLNRIKILACESKYVKVYGRTESFYEVI